MAKILVFAGSTRTGSFNRKLALVAARAIRQTGAEVTHVDLSDYRMPLYEGDLETAQGLPPAAVAFQELLIAHDAFAIVSPEYNGSFPAMVKNLIDWTSRASPDLPVLVAYKGKLAAVLGASPGQRGARRGSKHLRELLEIAGVTVIAEQVNIAGARDAFDADGELTRPEDRAGVAQLAAALSAAVERQLTPIA